MSSSSIRHRHTELSRLGRLVVLCLALILTQPAPAQTRTHETAVRLAREGELAQSIIILTELLESAAPGTPEATALRHDLGVIRSWHGDYQQAVELLAATPLDRQPAYVLAAYAESLHRIGFLTEALSVYRAWSAREPSEIRPEMGVFHALIDSGDLAGAERQLKRMSERFTDPTLRFSAAYLANAKGDHLDALRQYEAILKDDPENERALRGKAMTALSLGAPWQALTLVEHHPSILTEEERRRILLDTAALKLRWSTQTSTTQSERIEQSSEASDVHRQLLGTAGLEDIDLSEAIDRAMLFDRVVAHTSRFEMEEAIAVFEQARALAPAGLGFPSYVLRSAADAYLYLRQPESAERLYREALAAAPDDFDASIGLFYAISDQGDYEKSAALLEKLLAAQPAWIRPAPTIWLENPQFATAMHVHALNPAYSGDYDTALSRIDHLLEIAPANPHVRTARAQVMRWRGWPRAAERETARALGDAPNDVGAETTRAQAMMDIYRFDEAERLVAQLDHIAPFDAGVRNVARRWALHNRPELSSDVTYRRSDGTAVAAAEWQVDTLLFSSPLHHRYRLFAHDMIRKAEFVEGFGKDHRLGIGVEYRNAGVRLSSELSDGFEDNSGPGADLGAVWYLDDQWSVNAVAALNSPRVPLRATRIGIRGDEIGLGGAYHWHEARELSATATYIDMDDGNERSAIGAAYTQRLHRWQRQSLHARVEVYASGNSGGERIYFNPERDLSLSAGLAHEWLMFRRYHRSLLQRFDIDVGTYRQKHYGSGSTWTVRLEHKWQLSDRISLSYAVQTGRRVYDGDSESFDALFLSMRTLL